jgi:hypothetical protein
MLSLLLESLLGKFGLGALSDPETKDMSSVRLAGLACVTAAIVYLFTAEKPEVAIIAAFVAGGGVAFLTRTKA